MDVKLSFHQASSCSLRSCIHGNCCSISTLSVKPVSWKFNTKKELSGDYIAGLVTSVADSSARGVFSALLVRRGNKNNYRFRIDFKFTIQLSRTESNKNLLLGLKEKFDNKGNLILYKKQNNTILYQITNQKDLLNVVIPFFMKYRLRGEKLLSFLRFKYLLEVISKKLHLNFRAPQEAAGRQALRASDKNIFLSLIVIAGQINPQGKLGEKIRYLNPDDIYYVKNNIIPEGVDISKLTESIANFKPNPLTLDFVHGLIELNTDNFFKLSKQDQDYIREKFLPKGLEHWKFKEYYSGLNLKSTNGGLHHPTKQNLYLGKKSYSTRAVGMSPRHALKIYKNADLDKLRIVSENKGKAGVYRWTNLIDGKSYVGSSKNLGVRLRSYLSFTYLTSSLKKANSIIIRSLLKYGYSNFSVEIIEYCEVSEILNREQYYIDRDKPEYNILKFAGTSLGHKHPHNSLTRHWTLDRKTKRLIQLKILNNDEKQIKRKLEQLAILNASEKQKEHRKKLSVNRSKNIKILDTLTNKTTVYNSIEEAAGVVGRDSSVIRLVMKNIKEKGVSRHINGRYLVVLDGFKVIQYTNPDLKIRIEVTDTWTSKKTVYETQVEAAKAIGSVSSNVANALKKAASNPDGVSKLIKKRFTVKQLKD